ncbi:MAG TPA: hypothetical protein VN770_06110 [Gaiellaceae bacterium]|nr:hypothetical protein [Gaiellaceae bacterium]
MSADYARGLQASRAEETTTPDTWRVRIVLALGPATVAAGVVWAIVQPWRLTLLHPHGQGLWWLIAEPPLYVVVVGLLFRYLVAPGLVADLRESEER